MIDLNRVSATTRNNFDSLPSHPSVVTAKDLAKATLPELRAEWVVAIEKGWQENVAK